MTAEETFEHSMGLINASHAAMSLVSIEEAGESQTGSYTTQAADQKAQATASMAARGKAWGGGSDLSVLAIKSNTLRQAWTAREQPKPKSCLSSRACRRRHLS